MHRLPQLRQQVQVALIAAHHRHLFLLLLLLWLLVRRVGQLLRQPGAGACHVVQRQLWQHAQRGRARHRVERGVAKVDLEAGDADQGVQRA